MQQAIYMYSDVNIHWPCATTDLINIQWDYVLTIPHFIRKTWE